MSGRGKSQKSLALIDAAYSILAEIHPATVRAVCYRLFVAQLIPSMAKAETDKVGRQLVWAREKGEIPWEWVVDETREVEHVASWDSPERIIEAAVRTYRKDYWGQQPHRVEVWSEKGTVRGTLAPVLNEFGVAFRVMHGYGSATAIHGIAEDAADNAKRLVVLYVGDWDCSGLHMSEVDLPRRIAQYGGGDSIEIRRIALRASDTSVVARLPSFDAETKRKDPRHSWFIKNYGDKCWELDALSPVVLRERVRAAIKRELDTDAWNHAVKVEAAERESMQSLMATWKNSISTLAPKYSGPAE